MAYMTLHTVYYLLSSHYSENCIHDIPKQANKSHIGLKQQV